MAEETTAEFERASAVRRRTEGEYLVQVPDGWQQGRGAFGGLVLGTLARAMEAEVSEPGRRLRTLSGDICGPVVPGPAEVQVKVLRRGANQTNVQADLRQDGAVLATATAVFSSARRATIRSERPAPPATMEAAAHDPLAIGPPIGPAFAHHYEYRTPGPFPFGGGPEPLTEGFIREREQLLRVDAPAMIARLDAWWPAFFSVEEGPRQAATISFLAELIADPASLDPSEPLRHRARVVAAEDGFLVEFRELWSGERLVAMNQQTFVVIR